MEGRWKEPKAHTREAESARKDRKSGTGTSGAPKKGGHGGKFTWSGDQRLTDDFMDGGGGGALDPKDPNFEDPEVEGETEAGGKRGESTPA